MVYDGSAHPLMPAPNVPSSPRDVLCEKQEKMIWFAQAVRHPGRSRNVRGTSLMVGGFGPLVLVCVHRGRVTAGVSELIKQSGSLSLIF